MCSVCAERICTHVYVYMFSIGSFYRDFSFYYFKIGLRNAVWCVCSKYVCQYSKLKVEDLYDVLCEKLTKRGLKESFLIFS